MVSRTKSVLCQCFYSLTAILIGIAAGLSIAWTSSAVPQLLSGELGFEVTSGNGSWIVSFLNIGHMCGSLIVIFLMDKFGRRWTCMMSQVPHLIAWCILRYSSAVWMLYFGRLLNGLGYGISSAVGVIVAGELPDKYIRGSISFGNKICSSTGQLIAFIIGAYLSYYNVLYVNFALTLIVILQALIFLPESPFFYMRNEDRESAERVLMKLRGTNNSKEVQEELEVIEKTVKKDMENRSTIWELFSNPMYRKSLVLNATMRALQFASGFFIISSYVNSILSDAGFALSAENSSILFGLMQLIFMAMSSLFVDLMGRKPLLILSMIGCALSLSSIGLFFFLQDTQLISTDVLDQIRWIPLTGFIVFTFSFSCGLGPVQNVLMGETFATNIKVMGVTFSNIVGSIVSIGLTKGYQITTDAWGVYVPFWTLSLVMLLGVIFTLKVCPETKNKTFYEIQSKMNKKYLE